MKQYQTFHFSSYTWDPATYTAEFEFKLDDEYTFTEVLTFPKSEHAYNKAELNKALFSLHIALGISYFKTCLPPKIQIHTGELTNNQREFFITLYQKGLGEFWYKNEIDWHGKINFPAATADSTTVHVPEPAMPSKPLVPIGGGKDSIVSIETLKKIGTSPTLFRIGGHPLITKQAEVAKLPLLTIDRAIDRQIKDLNEQGALNGHIPITAIVSLIAVVTAIFA